MRSNGQGRSEGAASDGPPMLPTLLTPFLMVAGADVEALILKLVL